jgi:hypothetical protein
MMLPDRINPHQAPFRVNWIHAEGVLSLLYMRVRLVQQSSAPLADGFSLRSADRVAQLYCARRRCQVKAGKICPFHKCSILKCPRKNLIQGAAQPLHQKYAVCLCPRALHL